MGQKSTVELEKYFSISLTTETIQAKSQPPIWIKNLKNSDFVNPIFRNIQISD